MKEMFDLIQKILEEMRIIKVEIAKQKPDQTDIAESWIDGQDVMQALHISKRTLQTLRDTGALPFSRINGKFYYKVSDIENMLETNYQTSNTRSHGDK